MESLGEALMYLGEARERLEQIQPDIGEDWDSEDLAMVLSRLDSLIDQLEGFFVFSNSRESYWPDDSE